MSAEDPPKHREPCPGPEGAGRDRPHSGSGRTEKPRNAEAKYRLLFQHNPVMTVVVDGQGRVRQHNLDRWKTGDRVPPVGQVLFRDCAGTASTDLHAELLDCIGSQTIREFEAVPCRGRFLSVTMAPFPDGAIITVQDVTRIRKAEQENRRLSEQIIRSEENERRKIAWLLHDELLQELAGLKLSMDVLSEERDKSLDEVLEGVKGLSRTVSHAIKTTREMSHRLHPTLLERFGLVAAVRNLCEDLRRRAGCRVDFTAEALRTEDVSPELAITLYRLIDEAFRNIRKHARAGQVTVRLSGSDPRLELVIQDDGPGFDPVRQAADAERGKHLGMSIMRERAALLRGEMKIQTSAGRGTRLRFRFPWKGTEP